ncbi:hypothetical protein DL95DRAFT_523587 [Leptodontidium sp. 2 PMI_412]|nr:hypothetical protein DL95DRAFT_523587 [Leptodontidium sp. 2 PMI_412]
MAGRTEMSASGRTLRDLPSQRPYIDHREDVEYQNNGSDEASYPMPGRTTYRQPAGNSLNPSSARNSSWRREDGFTLPIQDLDSQGQPQHIPRSQRYSGHNNVPTGENDPQYTHRSRQFSAARRDVQDPIASDYDRTSNFQHRSESQSHHSEDHFSRYHPAAVGRTYGSQRERMPEESHSPTDDFNDNSAADSSPWSRKRGHQQSSPSPQELDASPGPSADSRWSSRSDMQDYMSEPHTNRNPTPSIRPVPQSHGAYTGRSGFRTMEDESRAQEILLRDKDAKIEKRSSLRRFVMPKSKRTSFSQREIFRAIQSVIDGHETAGPGVVEVLLGKFIKAGGDINIIPQQSSALGVMSRKRPDEPSNLLEKATTCGDVEVVQLLSRHSNKTAKNKALEIALQNRNTTTGRDTTKEDRIVYILVSDGADVDTTIGSAVAAGEENLLHMLLEGNPPAPALSDALPIAIATRDTLLRRRLAQMLLRKGADVNTGNGQPILEATKLFDMALLDMLLERRPHVTSLNRAFAVALSYSDSNHRFEACQKLINAGATGEEVNKGLIIAMTVEHHNIDFLRLILRSASVDFENGYALCQAVTSNYQEHLKLLLAKRPSELSFDNALDAAMRLRNPRDQLKFCHLLVGAGPPRNSCSKALLVAVTGQKDELCRILLEARASVDFDGGASITAAARSENIGILEMLIGAEFQQPQSASLTGAFEISLLASPSAKKMKILRLILDAGLQGQPLDTALVHATKQGQEGLALCELLLKYGASVNTLGGEALDTCCRTGNLGLLEKLLSSAHRPAPEILSRVFQSSLVLDHRIRPRAMELILQSGKAIDNQLAAALDGLVQERRPHMPSIEVLLSFHASVYYEGYRPLITAAKNLNTVLLKLLLEQCRDGSAPSKVFEALMADEPFWKKHEAFQIMTILVDNGAEGIAVDDALVRAVKDGQPSARHFEITLLQHANIDHRDGEALQVATERGEAALVRRMLAMKPASESISMAFPYAFVSNLPESSCLAVIQAFMEMAADDLYPDYMHPDIPEPPVFLCIKHYPNSLSILEATLDAGFNIDQSMSSESGKFTAIYWAMTGGNQIGDHIMECLISRRANLHNHPEPLLHLAIDHGRQPIVQALLNAGADVDAVDENFVSPLSLAARKNDLASMQALLAAKALSNDGSLHEAARTVNADAITLLLSNGHDPNFPCPRFEGRPPLFELCLQAPTHLLKTQLTTPQKITAAKKAIECLIKGGALTKDRLPQAGNRSVLMHALDSANPHMMTRAFLECGQFKYINRDFNLFMDGEYTYSPTKYIEKGKCRGDNSQSQSLITMLKDFNAQDRYWKINGPQPPDMVNPPEHIAKAEKERQDAERRKREEEEEIRREVDKQQRELAAARRKLALEQEAEQAKLDRENRAFQLRQAHDAKLHAAAIAKENDRLRIQEARNSHALKQAASMSQLRNEEDEARHRRSMKLIGEKKMLAQSQEALYFAYNKGVEDAVGPQGRRALGPSSSKSNVDLGRAARLRIEGAFPSRIEEIDE